jgi:hypothetical protein
MAILEVCRRRLNNGVELNSSQLKSILRQVRDDTGAKYVFYSAIEEPEAFFQIGEWPSLEAYDRFHTSNERGQVLQALNQLSMVEWVEQMTVDTINTLPIQAPVMTVSRCLFKEYANHPQVYEKEVANLLPAIEEETKPWRYVGGWTIDTRPDYHKWLVFGGYRSKKHHQQLATRLKDECDFFVGMADHYEEGTVHRHCWNMETEPDIEVFETLQGFVPQKITKART